MLKKFYDRMDEKSPFYGFVICCVGVCIFMALTFLFVGFVLWLYNGGGKYPVEFLIVVATNAGLAIFLTLFVLLPAAIEKTDKKGGEQ